MPMRPINKYHAVDNGNYDGDDDDDDDGNNTNITLK